MMATSIALSMLTGMFTGGVTDKIADTQYRQPPGRHEVFRSYKGRTPKLDGVISDGEWADAFAFSSAPDWVSEFSPAPNPNDLCK